MASLNTAPRLLEPGLWRSDPSLEGYQVKGGGTVAVRLRPGNTITIQEPQGRQGGEVIAFDKKEAQPQALWATILYKSQQALVLCSPIEASTHDRWLSGYRH